MAKVEEELLNTLEKLKDDGFKTFKWYLELDDVLEGFKGIPVAKLENAARRDTVDLMVQKHQDHGALQLTKKILEKIYRNDLVQSLQNFQPEPKAGGGRKKVLGRYMVILTRKYQKTTDGTDESGNETLLKAIYTEVYITEGKSKEDNAQHEVRQLETASSTKILHDTPIKCHDIFKVLPGQQEHIINIVLTSGVAGVGKTFSVQKFILDWAEGSENKDISLLIPLPFRELNVVKNEPHSLLTLIRRFYPTLKDVTEEMLDSEDFKVLFILDGLDESRLSLDFNNSEVVSDVTQKSSVSMLLTSLIKANLLPRALIWITSRPAAANQILDQKCADRITELVKSTQTQFDGGLFNWTEPEETADSGSMAASVITGLFLFFCLLQSASAELPITAEPGDNVTLPCKAPNNVNITAVEWIRPGLNRSDLDPDRYVYLKTDGHLNTADQDPSYVNRVQLKDDEMKNGDLSLILKNVTSNDEGTYECFYVEETGGKKNELIVYLIVKGEFVDVQQVETQRVDILD
ncbi:NACHT, LRR and PYD domains-containing protein 3-like [Scomber japonicus]|uniref:NACHT, LRR and PYD domains-containing protein 3-like n=1 Tax=Scomber japonicus TaxID=13676 RepID=UPI0023058DB5|nr:NACHT, LRR and PYD domains-containing protein 3-like [Scomber japonicus]